MRAYLTIIGVLLTILSFGQKALTIDFHISPLYSYRNISSTNPMWNEIMLNELDSIEQPNTGLSYGFSFEVSFTKRIHIATGIERTGLSEKIVRNFYYFEDHLQPVTYSKTFYNKYQYIGIPLKFTYNVITDSHWNIGFMGSIRLDFLTKRDIEQYSLRNDNSLASWGYNKLALCGSIGIHLEYKIKKVSFFINPAYTRYLTPNAEYNFINSTKYLNDNANTEIKQHNYYLGGMFGLKYQINGQH